MIGAVSGISNVGTVKECNPTDKCQNTNLLKQNGACDSVSFSGKEGKSDEEKKELILKARTKAAGYSAFGGLISTLYYGLRSDEKVAHKYNLDPVEDKKLVKQIKREQMLWTLPAGITMALVASGAVIGGAGLAFLAGGATYLYNKCIADSDKIELKS